MEHGQSSTSLPRLLASVQLADVPPCLCAQSEDELVHAHEQARVAAEASGHTTSRRLQARAAILEQRRLDKLAAAQAAEEEQQAEAYRLSNARASFSSGETASSSTASSFSPPAPSSEEEEQRSEVSTSTSSMGVLVSSCQSFSVYSDSEEVDSPSSRPISPIHSDQFMLSPSTSFVPLVVPSTPPRTLRAPTKPPPRSQQQQLESKRSIDSLSSSSSEDSTFPSTPGSRNLKIHPLPGLRGDDEEEEEEDEHVRTPVRHHGGPPEKRRASGSLEGARFALAKLNGLELQASGDEIDRVLSEQRTTFV